MIPSLIALYLMLAVLVVLLFCGRRALALFLVACSLTIAVVALVGCQTTGGQTTVSVTQLIADASTLNNAVVTTTTSLLNAGTISSADAKTVLTITDDVQAAISTANTVYAAGNTVTAQQKIAAVIDIIATATTCVNGAKSSGAALASCIAPVLTSAQGL